jgi:type IV pilus assembly protein PilN
MFMNIRQIFTDIGEENRIKGELAAMDKKAGITRKQVPEQEYQRLVGHIRFANNVIAQKTFSWLALFEQLESVVPEGVAFNQIEPDSKGKGLVKLSGTTQNFSRLRTLLENMEQSQNFSEIFLLSHSDTKVGESQKGVTFTITCQVKMP